MLDILFWVIVAIVFVYAMAYNSVVAMWIVTLVFVWRAVVASIHVYKMIKEEDV